MLTLARDLIAQWLASTAKKHGYVPSKGKGAAKVPKAAQGRQTYTVALKEWVALAEFIAGMTPPIFVPNKLATLLDTTISLRHSYSEDVSEMLADSGEKPKADDQHTFFLNVLKRVRDILGSRLPADRTSRQSPKNTEEIINLFEHLALEELSEPVEQASETIQTSPATLEPIYKAERQTDLEESCFALYLLLHDLNRLRTEVSTVWARYKVGAQDLVAAAITTNTAVDLARSMTDDLKGIFSKHGGEIRMLQIYYAAQCLAAGTSESHKVRPGDDINLKMFDIADMLFWPAYQLLNAFCDVLRVNPTPEMKRGIYGHYEPHSDRDSKSARDKFKEDKILLLEMLPEFFYYCRTTEPVASRPPVEDELSRGLRTMFKTKEVTLCTCVRRNTLPRYSSCSSRRSRL
jgi:hypothetical protein